MDNDQPSIAIGHEKTACDPLNTLSRLLELLSGPTLGLEDLQKLIMKNEVMRQAREVLRSFCAGKEASSRAFLCSFLIARFPEKLFGCDPSGEEQAVISQAQRLYKHLHGREPPDGMAEIFKEYCEKFSKWQKVDKQVLIKALIERYVDCELSLRSIAQAHREETRADGDERLKVAWENNIKGMQQQIRSHLERVGGEKAMEVLEEAIKEVTACGIEAGDAIETTIRVPTMSVVPVAAIIHELCFSRHFDLLGLIKQYNPDFTESFPKFTIEGDDDAIKLAEYLRSHLLPIIPRGTRNELSSHLQDDAVKGRMKNGKFSIEDALRIAVDVMANSCAPVRDPEIAALKALISSGNNSTTVSVAVNETIRVIELMRIDFIAYELIQNRPVILESVDVYEKRYFQNASYERSHQLVAKYPDWTEWLFVEEAEQMESMMFDKQRLANWRQLLVSIITGASQVLINKHSKKGPPSHVPDNMGTGVPLLLKQRVQAAIKEAARLGVSRKRETYEREGFVSAEHSLQLENLVTEIAHFFRLHMAIHQARYAEH